MKHVVAVLTLGVLGSLASIMPSAEAQVNRYDDLSAWAAKDVADAAQFQTDLEHANSVPKLAGALQAAAVRQRKTTDDLISLVRAHPELRDLPTLGLDQEGLHEWLQSHPHGRDRLSRAPIAAVEIGRRQTRSIGLIKKNQSAVNANFRKYGHAPEVTAAAQRLSSTLRDNRRRLLQIFS